MAYAVELVRRGGIGVLFRQALSRLWSTTSYVWLDKDLGMSGSTADDRPTLSVQPASREAFQGILARAKAERGEDVFEILRRVSFYQRGFDACYLALTDSGEVCHFAWLLSARDNGLILSQYPSGTTSLKEGDVLLENIYTFPSFRGQGIMGAVIRQLQVLARSQGFRRMVAYVDTENKPSLAGFHRAGFRSFGEEIETHRFFRARRSGLSGQ